MSTTQLTTAGGNSGVLAQFNSEQMNVIKNHIAKGCTDIELQYFLSVAQRSGLDPFAKQIYMIKRKEQQDDGSWKEIATPQCSIDGYRLIADESGDYDGSKTYWCGPDGIWKDVWLSEDFPTAAKCEVFKKGCSTAFVGIAKFNSYAQKRKDGNLTKFWKTMPAEQLAKCAESLALRKAFPKKTSGIYTSEEMAQADNQEPIKTEADVLPDEPPSDAKLDYFVNIGGARKAGPLCISLTETAAICEFIKTLPDQARAKAAIAKYCQPKDLGTLSHSQAEKLVSELCAVFGVTYAVEWRDF